MIKGYKCFNKNLTNRYGFKFEIGKTYTVDGPVKFGNNGNGFHLCQNMEDTLRYFNTFNEEFEICEVVGFGDFVSFEDNYYGYYDMFAVEKLQIIKLLSREDIINIGLSLNELRVTRFLQGLKLNQEEIELFKIHFSNSQSVLDTIAYYQEGILDVYKR